MKKLYYSDFMICEEGHVHLFDELKEVKTKQPHGEIFIQYLCPDCLTDQVEDLTCSDFATIEEMRQAFEQAGYDLEEFADYDDIVEWFEC